VLLTRAIEILTDACSSMVLSGALWQKAYGGIVYYRENSIILTGREVIGARIEAIDDSFDDYRAMRRQKKGLS
jgi:hypothetical protein